MKKRFLITLIIILTACASPQVTATPAPIVPTDTPLPTFTPTPIAVDGVAQDSEGNFLVYNEKSQTWEVLPKLDADFERILVKEDGLVVAVNESKFVLFELNSDMEWVDKRARKVEDLRAHIDLVTQEILDRLGLDSWQEFVEAKVKNNPKTPYNEFLKNDFVIQHKYGPEREMLIPYQMGLNQCYFVEGANEWVDVSGSAFWSSRGVHSIYMGYAAVNGADEAAPIPLKYRTSNGSDFLFVPAIYDNDGKAKKLVSDADFDGLGGRLLTCRFVDWQGNSLDKSQGYMDRLVDYKDHPKWEFFYRTQVESRSPEERALWEDLITSEDGPVNQRVVWERANDARASSDEMAAFIMWVYNQAEIEPEVLLVDLLVDEKAEKVLLIDDSINGLNK